MKVTINDVARVSGVAISTVSMALRDSTRISQLTRTRVKTIAKELNFIPNHMAQALASNKHYTVGLLMDDIVNPFYATVLEGIQEVALNREYSVIIYTRNVFREDKKMSIEKLLSRRVDGLVMFPGPVKNEDMQYLIDNEAKFVCFNNKVLVDKTDYVVCNNEKGGYDITKHLIGLGHKRIAYMGPVEGNEVGDERVAGYKKALGEHDIPVQDELISRSSVPEKYDSEISRLLGLREKPEALFAFNDKLAIRIMSSCRQNKLRIPEDIAVVGFDNIEWAQFSVPPLTTINHPGYDMGKITAELLLDKIENKVKDLQHIVVDTSLVVRESCGAGLRR